jgi:hypothetical protein
MYWTFGALFAAGLPIGFFAGRLEEGHDGGILTGTLPPWFAVLAAVAFTVAVVAGSIIRHRRRDELERRDNLIAGAVGSNLVMLGYPLWFFLWKGGLVGMLPHWALFAVAFFGSMITYSYLKLRQAR